MTNRALLALENEMVFEGVAIGAPGEAVGEVVFNTAMTGYQEILTDPSYAKQIVTFTYPHIGNTGINQEDEESTAIWAQGMVIRDKPLLASNWRNQISLSDYLKQRNIVAIAGVDTRKLTRVLREEGAQNGCVLSWENDSGEGTVEQQIARAISLAKTFPGLKGMDLAREVTVDKPYRWCEGTWQLGQGYRQLANPRFHVVAYDFGTKRNILRMLVDRGCELTVVSAMTPAEEVLALEPDGIFLSNGPGDPEPCDYAIKAIAEFLETDIPVFGICLGLQLLGLAAGFPTRKMNHGHHGANHPVKNLLDGTVLITSQNHGFCIDDRDLPSGVTVTHRSLFDDSLQGIELGTIPAFGFQGHPEASPGPHDAAPLFDHFIDLMSERKQG
ncbi:MAG: glutamine-hydrolyzing carbamoyl-phosphate synthase small subunit [Gammaproteobacteria bacterium]|nr:glutamine-hydrolyzing carbamoyl-phosphate synthase small subunit [Gammaproteobacteria bacterium]